MPARVSSLTSLTRTFLVGRRKSMVRQQSLNRLPAWYRCWLGLSVDRLWLGMTLDEAWHKLAPVEGQATLTVGHGYVNM